MSVTPTPSLTINIKTYKKGECKDHLPPFADKLVL